MEPTTSTSVSDGSITASREDWLPRFLHDLNNLLGIILGNAELLQDGRDTEEKRSKRLGSIRNAAAQARDLAARLNDSHGA